MQPAFFALCGRTANDGRTKTKRKKIAIFFLLVRLVFFSCCAEAFFFLSLYFSLTFPKKKKNFASAHFARRKKTQILPRYDSSRAISSLLEIQQSRNGPAFKERRRRSRKRDAECKGWMAALRSAFSRARSPEGEKRKNAERFLFRSPLFLPFWTRRTEKEHALSLCTKTRETKRHEREKEPTFFFTSSSVAAVALLLLLPSSSSSTSTAAVAAAAAQSKESTSSPRLFFSLELADPFHRRDPLDPRLLASSASEKDNEKRK